MIAFTKEMIAFGRRAEKFEYIKRTSNHSTGFFKGIAVATKWDMSPLDLDKAAEENSKVEDDLDL